MSICLSPIVSTSIIRFSFQQTNFFSTLRNFPVTTFPTFLPLVYPTNNNNNNNNDISGTSSSASTYDSSTITIEEFLWKIYDINNTSNSNEKIDNSPYLSITDYAEAYRTGKTTPLIVAQNLLKVIQQFDQGATPLRAFVSIIEEDLMEQGTSSFL